MWAAVGRPQYPPPPLLEPGWYQDPTARFEARYWDGGHWTSHISHYGATGSDPMLVARFDNVWVRWSGRILFWAVLLGVGWWAFARFWPTDDRDLLADQHIIDASMLVPADLPSGFDRPDTSALSPLFRPQGESVGVAGIDPCGAMTDGRGELANQPKAVRGFANASGDAIVHAQVIAADADAIENYLTLLRGDDAGPCFADLWRRALVQRHPAAEVTSSSARAMGDPTFGDGAVWWRLAGAIEEGTTSTPVFADIIVVRVGRVASHFSFDGVQRAIGVDVHREVISPQVATVGRALDVLDGGVEATPGDQSGNAVG